MFAYTVQIKGMACDMCEAHINEIIRNNFDVTKVSSNHKTNIAKFHAEKEIDEEKLKKVITEIGYDCLEINKVEEEKKGFLGLF